MHYDTFINLGACCTNRTIMNNYKLCNSRYPFDWLYMDIDSMIKAIDTDLRYFFKWNEISNLYPDENSYHIVDKFYGFASVHDLHKKDIICDISDIKTTNNYKIFLNKMRRRKYRWIKTVINKQDNKICFIRGDYYKISYRINELYRLLLKKHKKMDFIYLYNSKFHNDVTNQKLDNNIIKFPIDFAEKVDMQNISIQNAFNSVIFNK